LSHGCDEVKGIYFSRLAMPEEFARPWASMINV